MKKEWDKKSFAIASLRRASYRWPGRYNALKAAKTGRNQYTCSICNGTYGRREVQLDHLIPVISLQRGWQNFDVFIDRLLCDVKGFRVLCIPCHKLVTKNQNVVRRNSHARKAKQDN